MFNKNVHVQHCLLQIKTTSLTPCSFCLIFHLFFSYATLLKPSLASAVFIFDMHVLLLHILMPTENARISLPIFISSISFLMLHEPVELVELVLLRLYASLSYCLLCRSSVSPVSPHQSPQTLNPNPRYVIFQQELPSKTNTSIEPYYSACNLLSISSESHSNSAELTVKFFPS